MNDLKGLCFFIIAVMGIIFMLQGVYFMFKFADSYFIAGLIEGVVGALMVFLAAEELK